MTTRPLAHARGVTLVELMVSLVVTSVVLSGVVLTVNAQQKSYYAGHQSRAAQMSARSAQLFIEQRLRDAGLDMDPALALDFSYYGVSQPLSDATLCPSAMDGCPRDSVDNSDELVFYARNKRYRTFDPVASTLLAPPAGNAWTLADLGTSSTVNINAKPGDRFRKGQILQAICPDGNTFAYFTVGTTSDPVIERGALELAIVAPTDTSNPFQRQDIINANPCFADALVFQIDRYRFHVTFPVQKAGGPDLTQPFLALDMGVDTDGNGEINYLDELLVAEGVETLQVAYSFLDPELGPVGSENAVDFQPTSTGSSPSLGTTESDTIYTTTFGSAFGVAPTGGRTDYFPPSFFPYPSGHAARRNNNQANIASVKVAMVVRSPTSDLTSPTNMKIGGTFHLFNMTGPVAWIGNNPDRGVPFDDGYQRIVIQSTVALSNVTLRGTALF